MFSSEDRDRRALAFPRRDLADEAGDVDAGRARLNAGRVVAEKQRLESISARLPSSGASTSPKLAS
jgi:hypothetical protein